MKSSRFLLPVTALILAASNFACEDEVSSIGGSIASGEVNITIDSLEFDLRARSISNPVFDARSGNILLGKINVPEYGRLDYSFVTRLLSISQLPDSIVESQESMDKFLQLVDSCAVQLYMVRGNFVGDSLAPQQAKVYRLTRQLPDDITNQFNPEGYYNPSDPLGRKNYNLVNTGTDDESYLKYGNYLLRIPVGTQIAKEIFQKYLDDPEAFSWPDKFAQFIPGLYVESSFGNGCLASFSQLALTAYTYQLGKQAVTGEDGSIAKDEDGNTIYETIHVKDSIVLCNTAPEVLSSNRIDYTPSQSLLKRISDGQNIITTPGGFTTAITFPARDIVNKYKESNNNISIVSGLSMTIPADTVKNDYGIVGAPYLLLVKTSELESFFAKNKLPDNKSSFYAAYSSTIGGYRFSGMRSYILDLIDKDNISEEDEDFSLVPVNITFEPQSSYSTTTYATKCVPYTTNPTMTRLHTDKATIVFTYSSQVVE